MQTKTKYAAALLAALGTAATLLGDVVETKDGARLVGKVTSISGGTVTLSTAYAGDLQIKQTEIVALQTDDTLSVRLSSGTRIDGRISTQGGEVKVTGQDGTVSTTVGNVAASWSAGAEDPQVTSMRRKWTFSTAADIAGKSGNTTNSAIGVSFNAGLVSPDDELKFYGSYQYATTTTAKGVTPRVKTKSADETKLGTSYTSYFSKQFGWFVGSELEKDDVEGIDLRSTSDAGLSMRIINTDKQKLAARLGAGYRFESYADAFTPNNKGAVLSSGLSHTYSFGDYARLVTDLSYVPAFDDFADYRFVHDSALEVPIGLGFWKLRVGVNNQYTSRPLSGREELDTTYYTRLILNWK